MKKQNSSADAKSENFDTTAETGINHAVDELIGFIKTQNAQINENIGFHNSADTGCSIYAQNAIPKGTSLVTVPFSACLTVDAIVSSPQLKAVFIDNPGYLEYPDEVLAIGLMYAKVNPTDNDCKWLIHVNTMPTEFNTTIYWSDEEMAALQGNNVFHLTKMMKNQMVQDFTSLHKPLSEVYPETLGDITLELYMWALSIVYSRSIELTRRGTHVRCIVPVLDMANHNPEAAETAFDTFHYNDDTDEVSFKASSDLVAGEECFAIYGIYPNSKLIYNYGFVILSNPHRALDLWTRLLPSSYQYTVKQAALQSHDLTRVQTYDFKGTVRPGYISPALLATIRVIQAVDEEEVAHLGNAFQGHMISVRNEVATYVSLTNLLTARLQPEKAEADREALGEMLLSGVSTSDRRVAALIVKVEERELLQEALQLVNGWMQQLEAEGVNYIPPDRAAADGAVSMD